MRRESSYLCLWRSRPWACPPPSSPVLGVGFPPGQAGPPSSFPSWALGLPTAKSGGKRENAKWGTKRASKAFAVAGRTLPGPSRRGWHLPQDKNALSRGTWMVQALAKQEGVGGRRLPLGSPQQAKRVDGYPGERATRRAWSHRGPGKKSPVPLCVRGLWPSGTLENKKPAPNSSCGLQGVAQ